VSSSSSSFLTSCSCFLLFFFFTPFRSFSPFFLSSCLPYFYYQCFLRSSVSTFRAFFVLFFPSFYLFTSFFLLPIFPLSPFPHILYFFSSFLHRLFQFLSFCHSLFCGLIHCHSRPLLCSIYLFILYCANRQQHSNVQ